MKTLAELKRNAKSQTLLAEMVIRCGDHDIPERLMGWRGIVDANSNSITFLTKEGKKSQLDIEFASLVEYEENKLTIYLPGFRDLNEEESKIMQEWQTITKTEKYQKQAEIDAYTDGSSTFWQQKAFFINKGYEYLMGFNTINGLKYDFNTQKIRDKAVKGEISMQYNIKHI